MNVTTWHDDVSLRQTNEWLAELRDDRHAEPPGAGTRPARGTAPPGRQTFPAPAGAAASVTSIPAPAGAAAPVTARAAIGDELRRPIMWCEMASCISYHADPGALGEADARARAIRAGWRIDAVGRLACPQCQQTTSFWAPRQVVPWDRATALLMTTLAVVRARRAGGRPQQQQPPPPQQQQQQQQQEAWHHEQPWVRGGRHARATPARPYISPA